MQKNKDGKTPLGLASKSNIVKLLNNEIREKRIN